MRSFLLPLLLGFAAPPAFAGDQPLLGSWQLVAAIPGSEQDSAPNGIRNLRVRFAADATLVDPTETLDESKAHSKYSIEGNTLTLQMGEGGDLHGAIDAKGVEATISFAETGMTWTLHRIDDKTIRTQRLPPESVEYLPPATPAAIAAFKYDTADYSKLPVAERLVGQWESVEVSGYGAGDFPPYGAPNEVWVFDGKRLTRHDRYHPDEPASSEYHIADGALLGKGGAIPFSFDEWGRLVVGETDGERTVLRRISREPSDKPAMPPLRIVLGYSR